jgi:DNA-binding transcriptional regulator YdaS (Cro superfamily)
MHLKQYLADAEITIPAFAGKIGVSVQAVHRYVAGERTPHRRIMERITRVTDGKVQPNDFFPAMAGAA